MSESRSWSANFLQYELGMGFVVSASVVAWSEWLDGRGDVDHFVAVHSSLLYTVAAPIDAAMLGFILAAAAIIVTATPAGQMTRLRGSAHYSDLWACFRSAMRFLGTGTVVTLVGLAITEETVARLLFFAVMALSVMAALRVARCVWALNWIIHIFTGSSLERAAGV
jgi:hypothetical protein